MILFTNTFVSFQLNVLLKEKEDEITLLSQRQLSDDDRLKLESIPSTILQLQQSQQQNIELQTRHKTTEQMWSQTLSNEKAAMQSVSDLVQKFNKRWAELTNTANTEPDGSTATIRTMATTDSNADSNVASLVTTEKTNEHPHIRMSKQILELQHKLQQAMENVQQAELSRENLKMALSMNTTLQGKLDELKGKYTALQNARSSGTSSTTKTVASSKDSATGDNESKNGVSSTVEDVLLQEASSDGNVNTNSKASQNDLSPTPILRKEKVAPSKSKVTDTTSSANRTSTSSSSEKLQREYRKVRKELTAMTTNHTSMMTANVRLLKQITEKDEMNAKSLSTILHLKSTTEKLIEERDHLEIQMKNASQLALAARLATNAKDRVSEELLKEKNNLDERRIALEEQLLSTQAELNRISVEWTNASSIIATKDTELLNMKQRCNRLVEENERYRDEIRQLKNAVSQAERDAREKTEKLNEVMAKVSKDGDYNVGTNGAVSSSSFTVEQLQTQVSVLKNRLACPVCHYRDKECIIIRCRHMHCKQCVDERVSNRSRKCPTCNVKFAENEVETIFLS
jgi:E3 ubiquitin-protein ligase BRE1